MMKPTQLILLTLFFTCLFTQSLCKHEKNEEKFKEVLRVRVEMIEEEVRRDFQHLIMEFEEEHTIDVWRASGQELDIAVTEISKDAIIRFCEKHSLSIESFIPSLPSLLSYFKEQQALGVMKGKEKGDEGFFLAYRDTAEIVQRLEELQAKYPTLISLSVIGQTYQSSPIYAATISSDVLNSAKPGVVYIGCQHAREWVSPMVVMYVAEMLLLNYEAGDEVTKQMMDSLQFSLIPVVNADGYNYSITEDRLWRKNRRENIGSNCKGVDLNRNWGYEWGGQGSSSIMCADTYRGVSPFSEPETAVVSSFISKYPTEVVAYVDFHAYGQYFMNPWGWTDKEVPVNNATQIALAEEFAAAVAGVYGKEYTIGSSAIVLYPAAGGSDDWAYGAENVVYSYTLELRDTGRYGFLLPPSEIIPNGEEIWAGVQSMALFLLNPSS